METLIKMNKLFILFIILSIEILPQQFSEENKENLKYYLGIVAGNPNGINPSAGIYFDNYGIRLSGGVWLNNRYGVQLDLAYVFLSNKSIRHQISLVSAYSHNEKDSGKYNYSFFSFIYLSKPYNEFNNSVYFGLTYSLYWNGFFIQAGPALGTGNFEKPKLIGQLGYLYIFD